MASSDFNVPIEQVALRVLPEFMGEPNKALSSRSELRWGKNGSLSVDLQKQTWHDHEDQTGGGVLDLLTAFRGYTKQEAVEWLQDEGFLERREKPNGAANGSSPQGKFAGFMDDWPVATYEYHDDKGRLAYEVLKFAKTAPRRYMQRRKHPAGKGWIWGLQAGTYGQIRSGDWFKSKEGKHYQAEETFEEAVRWLYHRDEVLKAKADGKPVFLCEGEKDAETLRSWGFTATTNAGGAKYWTDQFDDDLAGADVVILPDNDDAGRQRATLRGAGLKPKAKSVRVLDIAQSWKDAPEKADITDWKEQAGGTADQFEKLAKRAPHWKPEKPKSRFGAFTWDQVGKGVVPCIDWIVDEWLPERGMSVIGGASQSGKSFLSIHLAMSIARGQDFFDWPVKRGGVIYQAGEGGFGIEGRFDAYRKHFDVPEDEDVPLVVLPAKVDLFSRDGDTQGLIDEIKAWNLVMSYPLRVLFIDTYAMATVGSSENDGKDVGFVIANIQRIESECKCHVVLVHHMNADGKKLRGHTSLHANADTVIMVECDETKVRTATLKKQKDGEDGLKVTFALAAVPIRFNERTQRNQTSCVILSVGEKERLKKEQERQGFSVNPTERRIIMNLFDTVDRYGKFVASDKDGPRAALGKTIVHWDWFRDVSLEKMPEIDDRKKAADQVRKEFARAKDFLIKAGVLGVDSPWMWWAGKPVRSFPRTFPSGQEADTGRTGGGHTEPGHDSADAAEAFATGVLL
ncbi:MAG: AAA family ATPase [Rhizobiaceae bacterium]|nr:AAA family ATPase [Rhizobiaceae bacterium]MCV0408928.1 AAA family ATPase [Rhizobiaceae bacterium]